MRKGVVIAGYYGANNTGDEAILTGMLHVLRSQGITDITVLSRNPKQTAQLHGVKSIYIGRRFDGLGKIYKALRKSELFILGGGGLLQDYSKRVVPYWLSRVIIALLAGTPVVYYAQGIGPLRTNFAKRLVKLISNRVKWITVRDESSLDKLNEIRVTKPKLEVTADPALAIKITSDGKKLIENLGIPLNKDDLKMGIALRCWQGEEKYLNNLISALNSLKKEYNLKFYFFPFQFGEDESISEQVMQAIEGDGNYIVKGDFTPEQIAAMLQEMDGVIAMRLHALILSAVSHTPSFGLIYDPKVSNFMINLGIEEYTCQLEEVEQQGNDLYDLLNVWIINKDKISRQIEDKMRDLTAKSLRNAEIVKMLLKK